MNREERVEIFNKIMGQPIGEDPKEVPLHLRKLAMSLIFEELAETAEASGVEESFLRMCVLHTVKKTRPSVNLEKDADVQDLLNDLQDSFEENNIRDTDQIDEILQLDGLCDVQYTLSWAVNVLGHKTNFEQAYIETCRSNDSKACSSEEEAEATKVFWTEEENGEPHFIDRVEEGGKTYLVVKRTKDGKVRKSINYSPANFKQFFSEPNQ